MAGSLLPLGVAAAAGFSELVGHRWNVHGDFIYLLMAFTAALLIAIAFQGIAVYEGAQMLRAHTDQRKNANVACMAVACSSIVVCACLLISFAL